MLQDINSKTNCAQTYLDGDSHRCDSIGIRQLINVARAFFGFKLARKVFNI